MGRSSSGSGSGFVCGALTGGAVLWLRVSMGMGRREVFQAGKWTRSQWLGEERVGIEGERPVTVTESYTV